MGPPLLPGRAIAEYRNIGSRLGMEGVDGFTTSPRWTVMADSAAADDFFAWLDGESVVAFRYD